MIAPRIAVLPPELVNLIAAGEVIERPSSVVKELLDNALDSGATRIVVTIEDGGKQLIRVVDNGCGMDEQNLRTSVLPHATSKITQADDLYRISTMGFRGEALASISAVGKLRIASRPADQAEGHEIRIAGRELQLAQAAGCPAGTTVEVRDLFFNVPARRRFLRGSATETGHINEEVSRAALSRPDVAFELNNNSRTTINLPSSATRRDRVSKFYGPELAEALLCIDREERGLCLEAYAAPPAQSRATAQWQYVFVNGRYIRDRSIQHAIREAYRGLMEPNRHGVVFLFLTIDPERVDVNVHPTKTEVRWAEPNLIYSQVLSALREAFQKADIVPLFRTDRAAAAGVSPEERERLQAEFAAAMKSAVPIRAEAGDPAYYATPGGAPGRETGLEPGESAEDSGGRGLWAGGGGAYPTPPWMPSGAPAVPHAPGPRPGGASGDLWRALYGPLPAAPQPPSGEAVGGPTAPPFSPADLPPSVYRDGQPLSGGRPRAVQMHNLYLVIESDDGIIIVDQHALHERVMYEQLRQRITRGPLESQRLLMPMTMPVTARQAEALESAGELLARLGLEVTAFGAESVAVHAFPGLLRDADPCEFVRDLLDRLAGMPGGMSPEVALQDVLSLMACKAAVKAGDALTPQEIDVLIAQRHLIDKATNCPHGRPTMLRLTKSDLERQFKRT
jgi:DNA mismatch repair protein MutL